MDNTNIEIPDKKEASRVVNLFSKNGSNQTSSKSESRNSPGWGRSERFEKLYRRIRFGWMPAMLFLFVTFSLGIASAKSIATLLGMPWLFWPLVVGFTSAEALVMSWLWEPQKGYYTKKQMTVVQSAKWVVMGAGLVDGILLIINAKTGGNIVALAAAQAGVSIFAIFYSAGASMYLIDNDPNRIATVEKTDVTLKIKLEDARLMLQVEEDKLQSKQLELVSNKRARFDLMRYAKEAMDSEQLQGRLEAAGLRLALGIVDRYEQRVVEILGLEEEKDEGKAVGERIPPKLNGKH